MGQYSLYCLLLQVKDLEVELAATKEKGKENLQQALLLEKERITKMRWDMEELRRKSLEMELKLKSREVRFMFIFLVHLPIIIFVSIIQQFS